MLKFKLDENFSPAVAEIFHNAGYDIETVVAENLSGAPDEDIYQHCLAEGRCVITLDLDFANIIRFPSENSPGIIVVRPNRPVTLAIMLSMSVEIIAALSQNDPTGCLWIVEPGQLRMRKPKS